MALRFESERFATACPAGARQNEVSLMSITNLPYDPRMRERVQELRHKMTPMEKKLWYSFLRTYPVKMYKQRPIRTFVADFYCPLARLVIELDGSQHYTEQGMQYDKERSAVFEQYGVQVLRFRNQDVSAHFEMVCEQIHEAVVKRLEDFCRAVTRFVLWSALLMFCLAAEDAFGAAGDFCRKMIFCQGLPYLASSEAMMTERFDAVFLNSHFPPDNCLLQTKKKQVDIIMREIQVAENKTLKLTNVLARKIDASELGNLRVILTQMQNFIKSHSAMPVGPVIQCVKFTSGPNPEPQIYFMMQVNQLIPRLEPGYEQDAVLRVEGLPVRPLHRPHGPQRPCQPEAEHLWRTSTSSS